MMGERGRQVSEGKAQRLADPAPPDEGACGNSKRADSRGSLTLFHGAKSQRCPVWKTAYESSCRMKFSETYLNAKMTASRQKGEKLLKLVFQDRR
jgi:hypothetical protein